MSKIIVKAPPPAPRWCSECLSTHLPGVCGGKRRWCSNCFQMQPESGHECKDRTSTAIPLPAPAPALTDEEWLNAPDPDDYCSVPEYIRGMLSGMMGGSKTPKKEEAKDGKNNCTRDDDGDPTIVHNAGDYL